MIDYTLKRYKLSRSIKVRVEPDGSVVVTAPPRTPQHMIEGFVERSSDWIQRHQKKMQLKRSVYPTFDLKNNQVSFMGLVYELTHDDSIMEKVELVGGRMLVKPVTGMVEHVGKTASQWLKKQADTYFEEQVPVWAEKMGINYQKIGTRQQKSRWGSCSSAGVLTFNWRLIHFNKAVIDYVIVHELAHIKYLNHSKDFWGLVREYVPDYRQHVRFLKNQVVEII